jgi:hypothetical protein
MGRAAEEADFVHAAWNQPSDEEKWPEAAHDITAEGRMTSPPKGTSHHAERA